MGPECKRLRCKAGERPLGGQNKNKCCLNELLLHQTFFATSRHINLLST